MRHGKKLHKLERPREHRLALMSNLATALITHGRIKTTTAKAKALKPVIDRLIRTAKMNSVQSRRQVAKVIRNKEVLGKLFDEIAPEMLDRTSGYSRIMRIGPRRGDGAELAVIEIVAKDSEEEVAKDKTGRKSRGKTSSKTKKSAAAKKETPKAAEAPEPAPEEETAPAEEAAAVEAPVEESVDEAEAKSEGAEGEEKPAPEEPAEKSEEPDKPEDEEKK